MRRAVLLGAVAVMAADVARTNETLHLAYCSYCSEESLASWSCRWCNDTRADIDLVKYMNDDTNGTRGFVGVDAENERVVVSFRGSYNNPNTLEDAAFWLHQLEGAPEGVLVHRGFDYAWSTLANDTRAAIDLALERCEGCTVLFTGHSLGAAMATLAALDLTQRTELVPVLFTFGCPRVGNEEFAAWAAPLVDPDLSARVARERDIVPHIPPQFIGRGGGYQHIPREVWNRHDSNGSEWLVDCDATNGEDPECSDSEINYSGAQHTEYLGFHGGYC